jgi:hypothetical protein
LGTHAAVKDELNIVASVADAAAAEHRLVARRARTICQQLDRGRSPARVAAEQAPELATALRQASRRTSVAATLVLRAIVRTLADGGQTRRQIAEVVGVSHQRVTALLKLDE